MMDSLQEDCLLVVFSFLNLKERLKCMTVCSEWRRIVERVLLTQVSLGNESICCKDSKHRSDATNLITINKPDDVPKFIALTKLCPNIRSIGLCITVAFGRPAERLENAVSVLREVFVNCSQIECVSISGYCLGFINPIARALADTFGEQIKHITLKGDRLSEDDAIYMLKSCPNLEVIKVFNIRLPMSCLEYVGEHLESVTYLPLVPFPMCAVGPSVLDGLAKSKAKSNITELDVAGIVPESLMLICYNFPGLQKLTVHINTCNEFEVNHLACLRNLINLVEFGFLCRRADLYDQLFDNHLEKILDSCPKLTSLHLSGLRLSHDKHLPKNW